MRKVCLINNYNYGVFLNHCLVSVVGQTVEFDVIYVVDDGSTDNSREVIEKFARDCSYVKPVYKKNAGQLSCFNAAVDYIEPDDIVFLLDSDDFYPSDYLEEFLTVFRQNKSDMYFCETSVFENEEDAPKTSVLGDAPKFLIPASVYITQITRCWVGSETSAIVVTGELLRDVFPYPYESDWVTRADDVLVFASSLSGRTKAFVPSLCVGYRRHGENSYFGKKFDKEYAAKRMCDLRTLFLWCYGKYSLPRFPSLISAFVEYKKSKKYFRSVLNVSIVEICKKYVKCLLRELSVAFKPNRP